jgi:hypothetical protein
MIDFGNFTMRIDQLCESTSLQTYKNWVKPNAQTIKDDYAQYERESSRWENRARSIQSLSPLFSSLEDFKEKLGSAEVKEIGKEFAARVHGMSLLKTISALKSLIGTYSQPKELDRIIAGFEAGDKMPMPILVKGKKGYAILSGNTRCNAAFIQGIRPTVLIIDLSDKPEVQENRPLEVTKR